MNRIRLRVGQKVWFQSIPYKISKINGETLLLELIGDENAPITKIDYRQSLALEELAFKSPFENTENPIWDTLSDAQQDKARIQLNRLSPYFEMIRDGVASMEAAGHLAKENGVSVRTIFTWLQSYKQAGLAGLAPSDKKGGKGMKRLSQNIEIIIQEKIDQFFLKRPGVSVSKLVEKIKFTCEEKGLKAPSRKTVQERIDALPEARKFSAREGKHAAKSKYHVSRGAFPGADFPLSVVQFDHTPLDIMVVDSEFKHSIGRPYLTMAIDVYSRMIYGYFLTLQPPSYVSVAMCLLSGIQPKDSLLAKYQLDADDWPVFGLPACIHVDNGKDFRSKHLADFCGEYQINLEFRPIRTPQYGGHVERLFRTFNQQLHELHGTTFSSVHEKGDYKSEKQACMTLDVLEKFIINSILEYHLTEHSSLKMSPKLYWTKAFSKGLIDPCVPLDEQKMVIDLLPYETRTIQKDGIGIFALHYTDPVLQTIRYQETERTTQYKVKYDPRDISKIYLLNPYRNGYEALYISDRRFDGLSLNELRQMKQVIKSENQTFNTKNLRQYQLRKQVLVEEAEVEKRSKRYRRDKERNQRGKNHANKLHELQETSKTDEAHNGIDPYAIEIDDLD